MSPSGSGDSRLMGARHGVYTATGAGAVVRNRRGQDQGALRQGLLLLILLPDSLQTSQVLIKMEYPNLFLTRLSCLPSCADKS